MARLGIIRAYISAWNKMGIYSWSFSCHPWSGVCNYEGAENTRREKHDVAKFCDTSDLDLPFNVDFDTLKVYSILF